MNVREARAIIDPAIKPMRHALWLGVWHINTYYGRLDDGVLGETKIGLHHQNARITIDHAQHDTATELYETLRHELLHLAAAYFDQARRTVRQFIQGDGFDAIDESFTLGAEHTVSAMERMLDGNGLTAKKLIGKGMKMLGEEE